MSEYNTLRKMSNLRLPAVVHFVSDGKPWVILALEYQGTVILNPKLKFVIVKIVTLSDIHFSVFPIRIFLALFFYFLGFIYYFLLTDIFYFVAFVAYREFMGRHTGFNFNIYRGSSRATHTVEECVL